MLLFEAQGHIHSLPYTYIPCILHCPIPYKHSQSILTMSLCCYTCSSPRIHSHNMFCYTSAQILSSCTDKLLKHTLHHYKTCKEDTWPTCVGCEEGYDVTKLCLAVFHQTHSYSINGVIVWLLLALTQYALHSENSHCLGMLCSHVLHQPLLLLIPAANKWQAPTLQSYSLYKYINIIFYIYIYRIHKNVLSIQL